MSAQTLGLCVDHHEIFDSTDERDHQLAATFCAACPIAETCAQELQDMLATTPLHGRPEGTWAGRLLIDGTGRNAYRRRLRSEGRIA